MSVWGRPVRTTSTPTWRHAARAAVSDSSLLQCKVSASVNAQPCRPLFEPPTHLLRATGADYHGIPHHHGQHDRPTRSAPDPPAGIRRNR